MWLTNMQISQMNVGEYFRVSRKLAHWENQVRDALPKGRNTNVSPFHWTPQLNRFF
jgi:hypothetical protein